MSNSFAGILSSFLVPAGSNILYSSSQEHKESNDTGSPESQGDEVGEKKLENWDSFPGTDGGIKSGVNDEARFWCW